MATALLLMLIAAPNISADERQERLTLRWMRNKPPISAISIHGNHYFSDSEIKKRMYSRQHTLWSTLKGDRRTRVQRESPGRDTLEIKYLYLTNGFLGVQIDQQFETVAADSSARIVVNIDEGRQFRFGEISVEGSFDDRFNADFYNIYKMLKTGEKASLFKLRQVAFDMKTVFANDGYPYAKIDYDLDTINGGPFSPVTFHVKADSIVHFGKVAVSGIDRYPSYTVLRESRIMPGDIYQRQAIIDSQRRLLESGYFSTVRIIQADSASDRLNPEFILRVRERKPMYATIKTGAGQSEVRDLEWDFKAAFGKRNFLGSRRYDLSAQLKFAVGGGRGLLEHLYRIRYTEPWCFGIRMPLVLAAEWKPGVKDPEQDYRIETWSLSASTVKNFGEEIRVRLGLEYESVYIYGVPVDEALFLKEHEGLSLRRKIYLDFRRDSRDHIFIPRHGSLTDFRGEYYGGFLKGKDHFTKFEASWSSYQPVWPGWISATRFKVGWAQPFGDSKNVPMDDRFYLGGATTVRGFKVNSLGPEEKADFIALFNQEFRWQTFQMFQFVPLLKDFLGQWPLWQSIFFDMGNGYRKAEELSFRSLAYSYGTGVQIISPAGPIRIDYARRIKTAAIDFDDCWYFTILYAF
ncbi:MAG: BamA/TamA family outer membrane protein [candidate division Zixibacteria bacterium]|nr:BamA/TamA family outer membrane protein [candidate division Zixibacteria bacterium]